MSVSCSDLDTRESSVTFKDSLLILSQLSSCGLRRRRSVFCSPQQLSCSLSGHEGYCQHLTHCLSSPTRPHKSSLRADGPGLSGAKAASPVSNGSQTMMQSRGIPPRTYRECPITPKSIIISRAQRGATALPLCSLTEQHAPSNRTATKGRRERGQDDKWRPGQSCVVAARS